MRPRLSHTEAVDEFDTVAAGPADARIGAEPRCSQDSQGERRIADVAAAGAAAANDYTAVAESLAAGTDLATVAAVASCHW